MGWTIHGSESNLTEQKSGSKEEDFFNKAEEQILSKEEEAEMYQQFQSVIAIVEKISDMVKLVDNLEDQNWFKY